MYKWEYYSSSPLIRPLPPNAFLLIRPLPPKAVPPIRLLPQKAIPPIRPLPQKAVPPIRPLPFVRPFLPKAIPLIRPLLINKYNKVITSQERTPPLLMPLFIAEGMVSQEVDYCICKISFVAFIFLILKYMSLWLFHLIILAICEGRWFCNRPLISLHEIMKRRFSTVMVNNSTNINNHLLHQISGSKNDHDT